MTMKALLLILASFMTLSSVFDWDPGPAPGVKIKNAILYLLCVGVVMKIARQGQFKLQMPMIHGVFTLLISYAILTFIVIVSMHFYPAYKPLPNALLLKNLVDEMLFFVVFFYGVRDEGEAISVLHFLLACWALSHVVAVLDASGIVHIGDLEQRSDGRVNGAVGESNQYGAFVALSLPGMIAAAAITKGARRLFWMAVSLISAVTLLLTVSRGAYVGMTMGCIAGALLFRRYIPGRKIFIWGAAVVGMVIFALVMVSVLGYGDLLYSRLVGETDTANMTSTSSGRVEIWSKLLEVMSEHPISFLTGHGWMAYYSMHFRYAPHNFYLNYWFNLGLVGLGSGIYLLAAPVRAARAAIERASPNGRIVLIAFSIATVAFATSLVFVDVVVPWLYYFAYVGLAMRIAVNATESAPQNVTRAVAVQPAARVDRFGWATRSAHR